MSREDKIAVVEAFFDCILSRRLEDLPITDDVTFQSPLIPPRRGRDAAIKYLARVSDGLSGIHVEQHIVEGDNVATLFTEDTVHGPLPVFSKFRIQSGLIADARVFYDARIVTGEASSP